MPDWPTTLYERPPAGTISSADTLSGDAVMMKLAAMNASTAWPTAKKALFLPFWIPQPVTIRRMGWHNGATANANIDAGVYDENGALLASTGATVQTGASVLQTAALTTTPTLNPGCYYMALALDATTGTILVQAGVSVINARAGGQREQTLTSTPMVLPATATFAVATSSYIPSFCVMLKTVG